MTVTKRLIGAVLIALGVATIMAAPAAATGDNNPHKVWVCKYVGQPGDYETLKDGKQPIQVDSSATVGTDFADGQTHSYVIAVVTADNTDEHNDYTGEATCPTPATTTTSSSTTTSLAESTTTQPSDGTTVPTTSTTLPATSTTLPVETSTTAPPTTLSPSSSTSTSTPPTSSTSPPSTLPPTSTSTTAVPTTTITVGTTTTSTAHQPTTSTLPPPAAVLAYTGSRSGDWLALGICLFFLGVTLIACAQYRKQHPWGL